jgi:hypothetical protein
MREIFKNTMGYASRRTIRDDKRFSADNYNDDTKSKSESETERAELIDSRKKTSDTLKTTVAGYYKDEKTNINSGLTFSIVLGMELMYAHYWGVYGIPIKYLLAQPSKVRILHSPKNYFLAVLLFYID